MTPGVRVTFCALASTIRVSKPGPPCEQEIARHDRQVGGGNVDRVVANAGIDRHVGFVREVDQLEGRRRVAAHHLNRRCAPHGRPGQNVDVRGRRRGDESEVRGRQRIVDRGQVGEGDVPAIDVDVPAPGPDAV